MQVTLHGSCDAAFRAVQDAFAAGFAVGDELGAAVSVLIDGTTVVDLWGGVADGRTGSPWDRDTIVNTASAGKGFVAALAHLLVERAFVALDEPVADRWPEFAAHGKEGITLAQLLDHSAGLPAIREPLPAGTVFDWNAMSAALAAEAPWWAPGTAHGYHTVTFGFLVGEVLRRATGRTIGALLRDEISRPLGVDYQFGVAANDDHRIAHCPPVKPGPEPGFNPFEATPDPDSALIKSFTNPPDLAEPDIVNSTRWRRAEIPASNGHGNARALATFYGALASGPDRPPLLQRGTLDIARTERFFGTDAVLGLPSRYALGFMLPTDVRRFGRGPNSFGHSGAGGSLGFADLDVGLGFGYTPNQTYLAGPAGDHRWPRLIAAVYEGL